MYPGYCTVLASSTSSPDLRTRGFGSRGDNYDTKDAGLRKDGVVGVGVEGGGVAGREEMGLTTVASACPCIILLLLLLQYACIRLQSVYVVGLFCCWFRVQHAVTAFVSYLFKTAEFTSWVTGRN